MYRTTTIVDSDCLCQAMAFDGQHGSPQDRAIASYMAGCNARHQSLRGLFLFGSCMWLLGCRCCQCRSHRWRALGTSLSTHTHLFAWLCDAHGKWNHKALKHALSMYSNLHLLGSLARWQHRSSNVRLMLQTPPAHGTSSARPISVVRAALLLRLL